MRSSSLAAVWASLARDPGLLAYGAASLLGAPYFLRRKWRLLRKGRSDSEFDRAQWTIDWGERADNPPGEVAPSAAAAAGLRVAIMTASWGEVVTMAPLIRALRAARPDVQVSLSVQRREAIAAARALADEAILPHPFDNPLPVARWLARARPDLVVFYEQFEFPALARGLWAGRVPFVVVHARVKVTRAYGRWATNPGFKRWHLRGLRALLLATPAQRELIAPVAPDKAQLSVVGSIKFPHKKPILAPEREAELQGWLESGTGGAPLLSAGSTHETEEEFVLDAWQKVRAHNPDNAPVLLLAPRKPYRTGEVLRLLQGRGLRVSRRSQWTPGAAPEKADVLLLDTLGELGVAYRWSVGAFVGGTIFGSSHNVAEPLVWGIPVAYGPQRGNFGVEQALCEGAGVGFRVDSSDALAAHWTELLLSGELRRELKHRADALVEEQRSAFERTLQTLIEAVDAVASASGVR